MAKKNKAKSCENCANCLYICEGYFLCDVRQVLVKEDWDPTDDYRGCGCADWEDEA